MRRPFLLTGIIGIAVIVIGLVVTIIGPSPSDSLPQGFITPVIAFEFVEDDEQVLLILGQENTLESSDLITAMTNSTHLDFLFLALYGTFLLSFSITCASQTGNKLFYLAAMFAILAPIFDVLENLQLLSIIEQFQNGQTDFELANLQVFTWVKWGTLAASFLFLLPFLQSAGNFGRILSIFAVFPFVLGLTAYMIPGLINELFALSVILMFLLLVVFSFTYRTE